MFVHGLLGGEALCQIQNLVDWCIIYLSTHTCILGEPYIDVYMHVCMYMYRYVDWLMTSYIARKLMSLHPKQSPSWLLTRDYIRVCYIIAYTGYTHVHALSRNSLSSNVHVYADTVVHCIQYRRALSVPVLRPQPISPSGNRKHTELEHSFTDYGQRLKVEKIITGHHPTSQRTTVSPKRDVRPTLSGWMNYSGMWIPHFYLSQTPCWCTLQLLHSLLSLGYPL